MDKTVNSAATIATRILAKTGVCAKFQTAVATSVTVLLGQQAPTAKLIHSMSATAIPAGTQKPFARTSWATMFAIVLQNMLGRTVKCTIEIHREEWGRRWLWQERIPSITSPKIWRCNGNSVSRIIVQ